MSGIDGAGELDARYLEHSASTSERGRRGQAPGRPRLAEWRAMRRETRAERSAARREWVDQIPPWAFGILHR
jgi:hypothetical protein